MLLNKAIRNVKTFLYFILNLPFYIHWWTLNFPILCILYDPDNEVVTFLNQFLFKFIYLRL